MSPSTCRSTPRAVQHECIRKSVWLLPISRSGFRCGTRQLHSLSTSFAPRNAPEHRQTIRRDGALLVGTPLTSHLAELRHALGLFNIDSRKDARIAHAFAPYFRSFEHSSLTLQMSLNAEDVLSLARMGPSARHIDLQLLSQRVTLIRIPITVTTAVALRPYRPI